MVEPSQQLRAATGWLAGLADLLGPVTLAGLWVVGHICFIGIVFVRLGWLAQLYDVVALLLLSSTLGWISWSLLARARAWLGPGQAKLLLPASVLLLLLTGHLHRTYLQVQAMATIQGASGLQPAWSPLFQLWRRGDGIATYALVGHMAQLGLDSATYQRFCRPAWGHLTAVPVALQEAVALGHWLCAQGRANVTVEPVPLPKYVALEQLIQNQQQPAIQAQHWATPPAQAWLAGAWLTSQSAPWPQAWQQLWPAAWQGCEQLPCPWPEQAHWLLAMDFRRPWPLFARGMQLITGVADVVPGEAEQQVALALHGKPYETAQLRVTASPVPIQQIVAWRWKARLAAKAQFHWLATQSNGHEQSPKPLYAAGCEQPVETVYGWYQLPKAACLDQWVDIRIPVPPTWTVQPSQLVMYGNMVLSHAVLEQVPGAEQS